MDLKKEVTRRDFLKKAGLAIAAVILAVTLFRFIFKKEEISPKLEKTSTNSYGGGRYGG